VSDAAEPVPPEAAAPRPFPCPKCGAELQYAPGVRSQQCPYCAHVEEVPQSEEEIHELDFHEYLERLGAAAEGEDVRTIACKGCGAATTFDPNVTADLCPFCGNPLVAESKVVREIPPKSLLPFKVTEERAHGSFRDWLRGLWFAPGKLKQFARRDHPIKGVYIPYWTYDAKTKSFYRGERGVHYWVTETYRDSQGKTRTRSVRKTRWYPASGTVWRNFDDVLVLASRSLPAHHTEALEPWDLKNLEPYTDEYLAGFRAESYQVGLEPGFERAKGIMADVIDGDVRRDIGGDEQRVHLVRTQYNEVTFKHILLPIWISAYRWKEKVYRFVVNGRTGEVQGERPWSWVKIALAILAAVVLIGGGIALFAAASGR